ncbi:MAG TPA: ABC transporter permease [Methylophilaceae bacterium]|nr:ABC transporter permease [Methylophilaceae bacterium]
MELLQSTLTALNLLWVGDAELWSIVWVSVKVCVVALILASPPAILLGFVLASFNFPGRRLLVIGVQTLLALPTVVIGLILYMLLSRQGPFGPMHLLFTQEAMIIGEAVLAFPILAALTLSAVQGVDNRVAETARTLGAGRLRTAMTMLLEVRFAVMAAMVAGFGRVISEIGCAMMVGGNIAGATRNITTAIALETSKGEFVQGIALGIVLVIIALAINLAMALLQGRGGLR